MKIDPSTFALAAILMPLVPSITVTIVGFFMKKWINTLETTVKEAASKLDDHSTRITRLEVRAELESRSRRPLK